MQNGYEPYAYEALTVDNTVGGVGFTASTYDKAYYAIGRLESGQIRFTVDGTAPTTTVGTLLEVGEILELNANELRGFKAIRTGGVSGSLRTTFYT